MKQEAIKLELIEWLTKLDDFNTIKYLKVVKDANATKNDWWHDLTGDQMAGITRGIEDIDAGRVVTHQEVKKKYGI